MFIKEEKKRATRYSMKISSSSSETSIGRRSRGSIDLKIIKSSRSYPIRAYPVKRGSLLTLNVRLRLAVNDLVSVLLKGRPLAQLRSAGRVLYLILVHVVLYRLEVHRELGVVRQCLVLRIVLVQIEVIVVGYMRVGLDRGYVARWPELAAVVEAVELRVGEPCRVGADPTGPWAQLMTHPLIQRSLTLQAALELRYPRVDRRHLGLPLRQGQTLLRHHLVLLFVHLVAILRTNRARPVCDDNATSTSGPFGHHSREGQIKLCGSESNLQQ